MSKNKIPSKNYLILFGIVVLVICACFASYNLYQVYQEYKISKSPLSTKQVLYEDLKNATKEIDADTFLVVSYVQDANVYKNEKEIKKSLTKRNLIDNVMYLDITNYKNDDSFVKEFNEVLKLKNNLKVEKFPALVYYKEGVATITIDSSDHLLDLGDFEQIIDMYELAS